LAVRGVVTGKRGKCTTSRRYRVRPVGIGGI